MPSHSPYFRCVEFQSHEPLRDLSTTQAEYEFLEDFVEQSKPQYPDHQGYHHLIQTPFRYSLPVPAQFAARFRPPHYSRNVFYASKDRHTSLYETSYYFLRERHHLTGLSQTPQPKTLFSAGINVAGATNLASHPDLKSLIARTDYSASHRYIEDHPDVTVLLYPSCRCPQAGQNAAVFAIAEMAPQPMSLDQVTFVYESAQKSVRIFQGKQVILTVTWQQVN